MQRDENIKKRERFCKLAYENPKQAGEELEAMATGLKNCRNTTDVMFALQEIFAVSERTVYRDLTR